jgi:3-oxoacyl-[acyl-carrier-protein] synthase II
MAAFHVARTFGLRGYNSTVVTSCAAGTQAIGEAAEVIRKGWADVMVCGGTESPLCELALAMFSVGHAYSRRNDEPEKASRPFDIDRDGFVLGEGAGVLVLERLTHAEARGARIRAEVLGYGVASDAYHVIAPEPNSAGAARAITWALRSAGVAPAQIDYVNAHATGTPLGDISETKAIKLGLGERAHRVPITASKSMLGHLFGAAGAVEAIATIKTLETSLIHPTINLDHPDPECDLDHVPHAVRSADVHIAMSNSFGLGGQNAVVIVARYLPDTP